MLSKILDIHVFAIKSIGFVLEIRLVVSFLRALTRRSMSEFKTVNSNYFTFTFLISQFSFVTSFSFISEDSGLGLT